MSERMIPLSDLEREVLATCLTAEIKKVKPSARNAPENHPDRIAGRASDNAKAMMRVLEARAA